MTLPIHAENLQTSQRFPVGLGDIHMVQTNNWPEHGQVYTLLRPELPLVDREPEPPVAPDGGPQTPERDLLIIPSGEQTEYTNSSARHECAHECVYISSATVRLLTMVTMTMSLLVGNSVAKREHVMHMFTWVWIFYLFIYLFLQMLKE